MQAKRYKRSGVKKGGDIDKVRLLQNLPGVVYRCVNDRNWTMLEISAGCVDLLEYQPEDLIGNNVVSFGDLIEPNDRKMVSATVQKALKHHRSFILEYRVHTASGKVKWVWEQGIGVYSDDGKPRYLEGYITEITESQILSKEEKYRLLVENIKDGIVISQSDKFIFFNRQFATMLGYTVDELLMRDYRDVYNERGLAILYERSRRRERGEQVPSQYETVFKRKDGSEIDVEANVTIINYQGNTATFAVIRDITERKKAEREIQRQKQYFQAIFDSASDAIVSLDLHGNVVNVNPSFEKLFGYTQAEIQGRNLDRIIVDKEDYHDAADITKSVQAGGIANLDRRRRRKDGSYIDVSVSGAPISIDGEHIGALAIYRDITERKRFEEALSAERNLMRTMIDHLPNAIYVKNTARQKTLSNPADFHNMGAESESEVLGKTDFDFFPPELAAAFDADDKKVIQNGEAILDREEKVTRPDGSIGWQITSKIPLKNAAGQVTGLVGIGHDITERKKAEEERERIIRELQKALDKVNTLSGLIPICANCKRIRDDKGYWNDVESYISKHSAAEFSHGLCDDCMKKLYPEQYERLRKQKKR
ncbi:MAG: PAS domain-containing protein [Fidelibacterota bacterium]